MKTKSKNNSVSYFDMQFITSSISTTLVLLLLGLVVFFVLTAHNLSVYVKQWEQTRKIFWVIIRFMHLSK